MTYTRLFLGDLDISPQDFDSPGGGYTLSARGAVDGTGFGNAKAVGSSIDSLLRDGSRYEIHKFENRELPIVVEVRGETSDSLAHGEAALQAEVGKPNTLTVTPPDGWGAPTVFDVVESYMDYEYSDANEQLRIRLFVIHLTCKPFPRSADEVVSAAIADSELTPLSVQVDDCSSVTGWSADPGTVTVVSGSVRGAGSIGASLTRVGAIDLTDTPFLVVDFKVGAGPMLGIVTPGFETAGVVVSPDFPGFTRLYLTRTGEDDGSFKIQALFGSPNELLITNILRTNQAPAIGTPRQLLRSIPVEGSARTEGNLLIEHPTDSLGDVLAYSWKEQGGATYIPAMRIFRVSGGSVTTDASTVSGSYEALSGTPRFEIREGDLPSGPYLLMARLRTSAPGVLSVAYSAEAMMGSASLAAISGSRGVALTAEWRIVSLARIQLPLTQIGTAGETHIELSGASSVDLDEAWLFNTDIGALTQVKCGDGTPALGGSSNRLWITPTTAGSESSVLRGTLADQTDAFIKGGELESFMEHEFDPGGVKVFTVCTNALNAAVTLKHFPRWRHHAGG